MYIGDSITDADREHPAYRPLGFGYVQFVANTLLAKYPRLDLRIINTGNGGDTVLDLKKRWEKDCLKFKPEVFKAQQSYIDAVDRLAVEFGAILVPSKSQIDEQIKRVPPEKWSADSVYPYLWAHAWIAQRWLQATGL